MSKSFLVETEEAGNRLDRFLQTQTGLSRKKVKKLLDEGRIRINDRKVIIASWIVKKGQTIAIQEAGVLSDPNASEYFLKVAFEDAALLVVEKDPGVPCEPTPQSTRPTIIEIINAYLHRRHPHLKGHYVGPVHRLDRDTSGLMVFTKKKEANRLAHQFKNHTIKRRYLAIVSGRLEQEEGTIRGFLQKSSLLKGGKKVKTSTSHSGKEAITHWRLLERYPKSSLIEITLNTGRTHQIRVHLSSLGHPVIGDKIYGEREARFARQALHASFLGFKHPLTGEWMEFESSLPRDMRRLVDRLRVNG